MPTGQLESVDIANGVSPKTGKPWTRYDVCINGNKYVTFKAPLGMKALNMGAGTVEFSGTEAQNGQYTNYTLTDIGPGNGAGVSAPVDKIPITTPSARIAPNVMEENKDKRTAFMQACSFIENTFDKKKFETREDFRERLRWATEDFYDVLQNIGKTPEDIIEEVFEDAIKQDDLPL